MPDNQLVYGPDVIATVVESLQLNHVVLPTVTALTESDVIGRFSSSEGYSAKIRIKYRLSARTLAVGEKGAGEYNSDGSRKKIVYDTVKDSYFPIDVTDRIYTAVPITDTQLTLGPQSIWDDVVGRQSEAVRDEAEAKMVATISGAVLSRDDVPFYTDSDPYDLIVDGVAELRQANVPGPFFFVGGADTMRRVRKHPSVKRFANAGARAEDALATATVQELGGATIVDGTGAGFARDFAMLYSPTAFGYLMVPPIVPRGAKDGGTAKNGLVSYTWIADYDPDNTQDRSVLSTYWGAVSVTEDQTDPATPKNLRAIRYTLSDAATPAA